MDELYRLTLTPYYNDEVLSQLEYSPTNSRDKLNSKRIVEGFLSSVMTLPRSEILRVYIANDDSLYSYTRTPNDMPDLATYAESSWYNEAKETTKPLFIEPHMERVYGEKPTTVFSVVRQLRSKNDNSKTIGVVKVDADYSGISKICNKINLNAGGLLLIVNSQNQVLYRSAPIPSGLEDAMADGNKIGQSGTITLNGQKYLVNVLSLSNYSITDCFLIEDALLTSAWKELTDFCTSCAGGVSDANFSHAVYQSVFCLLGKEQTITQDTMPVIKMAKEYINQHFCESISLSEVADYCNVNSSYLSNLFHKQLGISYSKYLMQIRMERAVAYLKDSPETKIYEIGEKLGFVSTKHFISVFKKYYGVSPTTYQKEQRES